MNKLYNIDCIDIPRDHIGTVDLIYIDPPYATGRIFKNKEGFGFDDKNFDTSAYDGSFDSFFNSIKEVIKPFELDYLKYMYPRIKLMKDLLTDNGSIYVHCDYRMYAYLKIINDHIFGKDNFINQIIWSASVSNCGKGRKFSKSHDIIMFYTKNSKKYIFNQQYQEYSEGGLKPYRHEDEKGKYRYSDISAPSGNGFFYDLGYG